MIAAAKFQCVAEGPYGRILLCDKVAKAYRAVQAGRDERSTKRRVRLSRYFNQFCTARPHCLNDEQFKREGAFPDGQGKQVAVWEFKAWQWRVYGVILKIDGVDCFVGLEVDEDKKKDKADQGLLRATARGAADLVEYRTNDEEFPKAGNGGKDVRAGRRGGRSAR